MTRQNIFIGSAANDGTGDTLRATGQKINQNFREIYERLGGDSSVLSAQISLVDSAIIFEGTGVDDFETRLEVANPTADRTVTFPNATGNVVLDTTAQTLTNKTLTSPFLTTPQIDDSAGDHQYIITPSELAADRNVNLPILTDSDTFVFQAHTQTLTNKTLTTPTLNSPTVGTLINDTNGNEVVKITATSSAVNEITLANAATGSGPTISSTGDDTNIDLNLSSKGTGAIKVKTKIAFQHENFTAASGSVDLTVPLTVFNRATAIAATLGNGDVTGQTKKLVNVKAGVVTVTPTTFSQGTSFTLKENGAVECIWIDDNEISGEDGWHLLGFDSSSTQYITIT